MLPQKARSLPWRYFASSVNRPMRSTLTECLAASCDASAGAALNTTTATIEETIPRFMP
jgi:hypothetical protein